MKSFIINFCIFILFFSFILFLYLFIHIFDIFFGGIQCLKISSQLISVFIVLHYHSFNDIGGKKSVILFLRNLMSLIIVTVELFDEHCVANFVCIWLSWHSIRRYFILESKWIIWMGGKWLLFIFLFSFYLFLKFDKFSLQKDYIIGLRNLLVFKNNCI